MKILGLHGYQTSSSIFKIQSKYLMNLLNKKYNQKIEWIIPDAPNLSNNNISPIVKKCFKPPYYDWYQKDEYYNGLNKSMDYLKQFKNIDGIISFSQGSCVSYLLSDILNPKFIINICGVNYTQNKYQIKIPSLHLIGKEDPIKFQSFLLTENYINPYIIYHKGSHSFPPDKESYQEIINFIEKNY